MVVDRLSEMRLFVDAAQLGSLSAAGRRQSLSPAAASACIQRMETALGARLFERTTRRLRLTEEGELYRQYCQQALDLTEEAEQLLQAGRGQVKGTVRLSAPSDLGRNLLQDALDEFCKRHPEVRIALHLSDSLAHLIGDEVDLAIRYGNPPDSSMVARILVPNRRVICAAPALIAATGRPVVPDDLVSMPCLVLTTTAGPMNEWPYRHQGATKSVRVTHYHECNDGDVIRKWTLRGRGYAYKSLLDVAADVRAGRLETVLDDYFTESTPLNAIYTKNRFQPPRIKLLVEFLQEFFAEANDEPVRVKKHARPRSK